MDKKRYKDEDFSLVNILELEEMFNQYDEISFTKCTFNCELELSKDLKLRFSFCTFQDIWKHIICKEIVYSKCDFETFEYLNIGKEKDISKDSLLFDSTFQSINCEGIIFEKPLIRIVDENKAKHLNSIRLVNCEFEGDFILNVTDVNDRTKLIPIVLSSIDLTDSIFHTKVKIQNCNVSGKTVFFNTSFKDLADFYQTEFNEVDFRRTNFEDISVFSEVKFNYDVDFKYVKFLGKSIFRDTVIEGKLNLRDTIFGDDANFLDITSEERNKNENNELYGEVKNINVLNRETARIIKDFYDSSNNIIEANKFYSIEMKERTKELNLKSNFFEWIVFFLHGLSSNYSQSWAYSLFWIIFLGFLYTYESKGIPLMTVFFIYLLIAILIQFIFKKYIIFIDIFTKIVPPLFLILFLYIVHEHCEIWKNSMSTVTLNEIARNINIFTKINSDNLTVYSFVYNIIMSYLIYQFIISVRQNTRRK